VTKAVKARLSKPTTGTEGWWEKSGRRPPIAPDGKVSIHGEFWNAMSDQPIEAGEKVQVIGVVNLKLKVKN
jgi:membrane-bound serine protease (ClpP class)